MKIFMILLMTILCSTINIFSQVGFTTHIITTNADAATYVLAIDMDGDGDMDVLSASDFRLELE